MNNWTGIYHTGPRTRVGHRVRVSRGFNLFMERVFHTTAIVKWLNSKLTKT